MNIKMTIAFAALLAALTAITQEATTPAPAPAEAQPAPASPSAAETPASGPAASASAGAPAAEPAPAPAATDEIDLEEDDAALAATRPQIRSADKTGPVTLVDIDCDDATLADILRQFRKTTGANIISTDSTNLLRRVSASLRRVPWLQALTEILNSRGFRLDERDDVYRVVEDKQIIPVVTKTFRLNHASAKELADLFNNSYAAKDKSGKIISPIANYFDGANVVVVTAPEKIISDCSTIVKAVDRAVAQIYIEARFLELSSAALHKLGLDWSALESWGITAKNLKFGVEQNYGRLADYGTKSSYVKKIQQKTGETASGSESSDYDDSKNYTKNNNSSTSATYQDMSDGSSAIQNSVLVPSSIGEAAGAGMSAASMNWANAMGFSGQLSADDFKLALSAFEEFGEGKIFSNPRIIVSNGKQAKVDMTTKEPNVTIETSYTGSDSQNLSISTKLDVIPGEDKQMFAKEAFFSWGIELTVTPRISPDGLITVEIVPTISEKSGEKEINSGYEINAPYTTYPIISVKRLTTEFTMKDGSTAVIGGLSQTVEDDIDSGIPYLRKIPWIGPKLFGWKSRQKVQKEILICVTIGIANPESIPKDLGLPKNAVLGREYVNGTKFEPGDRDGSAAEVLKLDMRSLDDQREKADTPPVKATVVKISIPSDDNSAKETKSSIEIKPSAPTGPVPTQSQSGSVPNTEMGSVPTDDKASLLGDIDAM